ncbi:hypothetical protein BGW37DRAFT_479409 [Umbelopsis sp. PMI_123]|nr:hypothetical protein BGW37DRAFT_479409 [Umbelopsis sp. PMI_123]
MRFLLVICLLLTATIAHAATVRKQDDETDISKPLGFDLIDNKIREINVLVHDFQKTSNVSAGYQVVETEGQLETLLDKSILKCNALLRPFTPDETRGLLKATNNIMQQLIDSLPAFSFLKVKFESIFSTEAIVFHIKRLEERVDLVADCFTKHSSADMAKKSAEIKAQIDRIFAIAYAQLKPEAHAKPPN